MKIEKGQELVEKSKKVIVVTAGGTIEAIDSVRSIRNSSTGKLGAMIADQMKEEIDSDIYFVANRYAKRPTVAHHWIETTSVLDVEQKLKALLEETKVDIFIHSMAVADYYVERVEVGDGESVDTSTLSNSKLSSEHEQMAIIMKKAPKLISLIKKWQPLTYLVGFKLLSDTTEENLFSVGFNLLRKNRCNLVLANDLTKIREGNHEGLFIYPEKKYEKVQGKEEIASHMAKLIASRAFCKHSNSIQLSRDSGIPSNVLREMKIVGAQLYLQGVLPDVEGGTYGNLSIRDGHQFFITGRNVHKGNLNEDIVCRIEESQPIEEESVYAHVKYHGKVKPSIDSAIHASIYEKLPEVHAILHVHTDDLYHRPLSNYNYPCGTMEERDSIVSIMDTEYPVIQMKKHGVIITGDTLFECLEKWKDVCGELSLKPYPKGKKGHIWREWMEHVEQVGGISEDLQPKMLNPENYYLIQSMGIIYGLCYVDILKEEGIVRFSLYTSEAFQKKGLKIGERTIEILEEVAKSEDLSLELLTKPLCSVVEYYEKQGFVLHSEEESFIKMRK